MHRQQASVWTVRLRGIGIFLVAVAGIAAVAQANGGHHGEHGGEGLSINWWEWNPHAPPMGPFLIDFALFFGGLLYFAAKPMAQAFAQRHLGIKRAIADAAGAHSKASSKQHEWRDKLAKVESEVRSLADSSTKDGAEEKAQIVRDAQSYADRMLRDSQSMAGQELQRAQERLRRAVVSQALGRAAAILEQQLTDNDRQNLLEQSIVELEEGGTDGGLRSKGNLRLVSGGAR